MMLLLLVLLCIECDAMCTSGCSSQGTGKCDSACQSGYSLNTTDYTCMRASFSFHRIRCCGVENH